MGRTNDIHGGSSFAVHSYFTLDENCKLFVCEAHREFREFDPPYKSTNQEVISEQLVSVVANR